MSDFKCGLLLSKGSSSMPTKMKTRKRTLSSDIPPEEDPEDIDISDKGPVKNFRDLVDLSKWVRDKMKKTSSSKRKKQKKGKVTSVTKLGDIYEKLEELDKLIGLEDLKDQIAMQIVFFIQDLNKDEMMHTAIMGPPGMCKTTVTEILAKIYSKLGFLSSGHVVSATRSDLVGQFLGETSIKTRDVLETAEGGVLLLDEAYQLGDPRGRDSFAAECINTINQFLSENSEDFMCIVAGYKDKMYQNFFSANPGLDRRFTWKFTLKPYTVVDLEKIFDYQIDKYGWTYDKDSISIRKYIEKNKDNFKNNGGDTLVFFDKCKMAHSQRLFTASKDTKKKHLIAEDIEKGFKSFNMLKDEGKETNNEEVWSRMYM
tara:strand:- start:4321 stop:5433 length:1113 start_codon:yes stop_codon:yes gene_type:complete